MGVEVGMWVCLRYGIMCDDVRNVACACLWQLVSVHQYLVEYHLSGSCASSLAQVGDCFASTCHVEHAEAGHG